MPNSCDISSEKLTVDRRCSGPCGTKFGQWNDRPLSALQYRDENRKRYPAVKSRFLRKKGDQARSSGRFDKNLTNTDRQSGWLNEEAARLAKYDDPSQLRATLLSTAELTYLELVETDGPMDQAAAAAFSYLLSMDDKWVQPNSNIKSVRSEARRLVAVKQALTRETDNMYGDSWALSLLRAALVFIGDGTNSWEWATEFLGIAALSVSDNNTRDEAICLFGTGMGYAKDNVHENTVSLAVRFLDRARLAAEPHRYDWLIPADVQNAAGIPAEHDSRIWAAACFTEHEVLMKAARTVLRDIPDLALRAIQNAYKLVNDLCSSSGLQDSCLLLSRATVAYELGVRYTAIDMPDRAVEYFNECVAAATELNPDLALEAELAAARLYPESSEEVRDAIFQRIADRALTRQNISVLVKATAARGHVAMENGQQKKAHRYFAVAQKIAETTGDYVDGMDSIRLYAAVCRTCLFLQSNFSSLSVQGYDLLTEIRLWTGDERPLLIHTQNPQNIVLNADRVQDNVIESEAMKITMKISAMNPVELEQNHEHENVIADSVVAEKEKRKKITVQFK